MDYRLKLVPPNDVYPHEHTDQNKINSLKSRLVNNYYLNDPIQCYEVDNKYIILDGHHRYFSLVQLGAVNIPVQVIDIGDLTLEHWYHTFTTHLLHFENTFTKKVNNSDIKVATIFDHYTKRYEEIFIDKEVNKISTIWTIFNTYKNSFKCSDTVINEQNCKSIKYDGILFKDILHVANCGSVFPQKTTRFLLNYRVLNFKIPINLLFNCSTIEWDQLLAIRQNKKRVYYEPVIVFE